MKQRMLIIAAFLSLSFYSSSNTIYTDTIPANPKDVESADAIVAAVYQVISGPAGEKRNWDRMRSLFLPEARMISTGKDQMALLAKE